MKTKALAAAVAAALVLNACAWMKTAPTEGGEAEAWWPGRSAAAAEGEEVLSLLAYYQRLAAASAEEQRKEFAAVSQSFGRDKTENARFRLALLLLLPGASFRDDARLASLLETSPSRSAATESPRRQLHTLLSKVAAERQRQVVQAREEHRKIEAQWKDEQKRADDQQKRADEQQKRADDLQKRGDELQEKLDKLLAIERELRARTPRRPLR